MNVVLTGMLVPSSSAQDIIHRSRHERFQSIRLHIWITGHGAQIFWYQDGQGSESGIDRSIDRSKGHSSISNTFNDRYTRIN